VLEIAVGLAVLHQVFVRFLMQRKPLVAVSRSDLFVALFLLTAFFSFAGALYRVTDASEPTKALLRLIEYLILYLVVSTSIQNLRAPRHLMACLVVCGTAVTVLAIVQYFAGPRASIAYFPWGSWMTVYEEAETFRVYSFFLNPIYVGVYLVVVWPINLALMAEERSTWRKWLYAGALVLNSGGLLLTYTRAAVVGVAVVLLVMAGARARLAIGGGFCLLFLAIYVIPAQFWVRLLGQDVQSRMGITRRFEAYQEAISVYGEHPVLGVGLGHYHAYMLGGRLIPLDEEYGGGSARTWWIHARFENLATLYTAENTFLEYAAELGTPGVLAFGALWLHFLKLLWRLKKRYSPSNLWIVGFFAGLLGFLVASMFSTLTAVEMNSMFWILLGISKGLWLSRPRQAQPVMS
jgi:O-antigen ligase